MLRRPSSRTVLLLDVAVFAWILAWLALGVTVAREVRELADVADAVASGGAAIEETGELLATLADSPFVGERVGRVAAEVEETGASARRSGRASREALENLGLLLGFSVAFVPLVSVAAAYAPLRLAWRREAHGVDERERALDVA